MELSCLKVQIDAAGEFGDAELKSKPATASTGSATSSAMAIFSSVMRLTKLELAPFSSRRRTR
jgi:hypothetical protein